MSKSISQYLEVLVSLIGDDYSAVAEGSRAALDAFKRLSVAEGIQKSLREVLEENLHSLATGLPRVIRAQGGYCLPLTQLPEIDLLEATDSGSLPCHDYGGNKTTME